MGTAIVPSSPPSRPTTTGNQLLLSTQTGLMTRGSSNDHRLTSIPTPIHQSKSQQDDLEAIPSPLPLEAGGSHLLVMNPVTLSQSLPGYPS